MAIEDYISFGAPVMLSTPEETALQQTISGKAFSRRPEKALERHTEGLPEIFRYRPKMPGISGAEQRQVEGSCQT